MFDFSGISSLYSESSWSMLLFTMALTIVLSLCLVFTYDKTMPNLGRSKNFIQSLLLMSIVTSTIMQSIGDSLAFSFGIFGALAMLRFRSIINDPKEIAFIFATMAVGIACGVHSYQNAILGTITFCLIVFIMKVTPFDRKSNIKGSLRIEIGQNLHKLNEIEKMLNESTRNISLSRFRMTNIVNDANIKSQGSEYEYVFNVKSIKDGIKIKAQLNGIEGVLITRLMFDDETFSSNS